MSQQDESQRTNDLRRLTCAVEDIAESLKKIAVCICEHPGSFSVEHGPPTKETGMKVASFKRITRKGITTPVTGKGDTVTIGGFLNTDGTPYTGGDPTIAATVDNPAILTLAPPTGLTYAETFVTAGTATVTIAATFPDGTVVTQTDSVTLTPAPTVPGSFTVTHSLPEA